MIEWLQANDPEFPDGWSSFGSAIILAWLAFKFLQYYGHG
jgi:hypothetical protein